jgi:DNA-binding response OmpR family regulator
VSPSDRRVIALGNLAGDLKGALEAAVQGAGLELFLTREPARAFVELERDGALAVLVDMATLGAEQFCKRARSAEKLRGVPVIGMSRTPNELGFARVYAWGADDLVPLGSKNALERRLKVLATTQKPDATGFGRAVVAEATTQRRALVGRVLAQAGYEVKFAVDRAAVELYASQSETRLVVISAALGDPRRMIDSAAKAGALPTWIVTAEMRSVNRLAASLAGLDRVAVTSTAGSPEDVLFLANELVFGKGARRREWRALYATPVAFRPERGGVDEYGFSYDASPKGLYVRSLLPPETDDVELEIRLPARDERVRLTGKIMRRFAFGSGSIASAPPGFGIKLVGPEVSLALWAEACEELIAGASSEGGSAPPRAKQSSVAGMASAGSPQSDVSLALPPATLTIESVVAPLPVDDTPASVGDLLAATLDEQTLTEVGTRPVTMDPDTMGVREERPSEYGLRPAPSEPPPAGAPPPAAGAPAVSRTSDPAERALPMPNPANSGAPAAEWDSDAKTVVRTTDEPPAEIAAAVAAGTPTAAPAPAAGALAPGPRRTESLSLPMPAPRPKDPATDKVASPRAGFKGTLLMGSSPGMPAVAVPTPAIVPPGGTSEPPIKVAAAPSPVRSPSAFAGTMLAAPPAASLAANTPAEIARVPPAGNSMFGAPAPATKPEDPSVIVEFGSLHTERPPEPARTPLEPSPQHVEPAPKTFDATLESTPHEAKPADPAPRSIEPKPGDPSALPAAAVNPWERTVALGSAAVREQEAPSVRSAATEPAELAADGVPSGGPSKAVLFLVGVVALVGGAALVVAFGLKPAQAPEKPVAASVEPTAVAAPTTTTTAAAPEVLTSAPTPATSASPAGAADPAASAAPPEPSATPPSENAASAAVPTTPAPEFDLTKLPAERAGLFVRSSVKARVFVHGTEYGDTNTWLTTSCGIRFVRLGHKLGDFVEPGRSYVVKCGKATELTIEPAK